MRSTIRGRRCLRGVEWIVVSRGEAKRERFGVRFVAFSMCG